MHNIRKVGIFQALTRKSKLIQEVGRAIPKNEIYRPISLININSRKYKWQIKSVVL